MPQAAEVEPTGQMRFFVQPRWAAGSYSAQGPVRRRDFNEFTELEVELPFQTGSAVGVLYLMPHDGSSVMVATCFNAFFQPLRRLLYEPGNDRRRMRLWRRLPEVRPLFMAVNQNGLTFRFDDLALLQRPDPTTGEHRNLIVSVDRTRTIEDLDDVLWYRCAAVLDASIDLFEEALIPLDLESLHAGLAVTDLIEITGSGAKWLLDHAGEIADVLDLIGELTD
jgi:hypothetical protein